MHSGCEDAVGLVLVVGSAGSFGLVAWVVSVQVLEVWFRLKQCWQCSCAAAFENARAQIEGSISDHWSFA